MSPPPAAVCTRTAGPGEAASHSLAGTETCLGAWQYSLHGCMALLHVPLLPTEGGSRLCKGRSSGCPVAPVLGTHSEMLLLPWALPGLGTLCCHGLWEPPASVPAGLSGQDKDGLPRGATGDAGCWSRLAPREFWETSVLSFMIKEVCDHQAEEVHGQSGMDTNRKFGENRVQTSR